MGLYYDIVQRVEYKEVKTGVIKAITMLMFNLKKP